MPYLLVQRPGDSVLPAQRLYSARVDKALVSRHGLYYRSPLLGRPPGKLVKIRHIPAQNRPYTPGNKRKEEIRSIPKGLARVAS